MGRSALSPERIVIDGWERVIALSPPFSLRNQVVDEAPAQIGARSADTVRAERSMRVVKSTGSDKSGWSRPMTRAAA